MKTTVVHRPIPERFFSLLLSAVLLATLAACSRSGQSNERPETEAVSPAPVIEPGAATTATSAILRHGETAHKNHCYKCHTDQVYTREDRFVKSLDALSKQVVRCKDGSNIPWFDEDADAVVQFLNQKYYKF